MARKSLPGFAVKRPLTGAARRRAMLSGPGYEGFALLAQGVEISIRGRKLEAVRSALLCALCLIRNGYPPPHDIFVEGASS